MKQLNILFAENRKRAEKLFHDMVSYTAPGVEECRTLLFCEDTDKEKDLSVQAVICDSPFLALQDEILDVIEEVQKEYGFDLIVFAGALVGDLFCVRTAVRCSGSVLTQAQIGHAEKETLIAQRGVFSYNLRATFEMCQRPYCVSIDMTQQAQKEKPAEGKTILPFVSVAGKGDLRRVNKAETQEKDPLESARVVLVAGRGIGSRAAFERIEKTAEDLGGAAGATRPVATDGWADFSKVIGISGKQLSPEVCLVCAASGTMPFMMGIDKSKTIIAVNRDENASIFRTCDYGIVADWQTVIEMIEEEIQKGN